MTIDSLAKIRAVCWELVEYDFHEWLGKQRNRAGFASYEEALAAWWFEWYAAEEKRVEAMKVKLAKCAECGATSDGPNGLCNICDQLVHPERKMSKSAGVVQ